jgi:hypothetical protein
MAIDRKKLAKKLVQLLVEDGEGHPYVDGENLKDVTVDGWFDFERLAEKLTDYIESPDAQSQS